MTDPISLFHRWFAEARRAGLAEPEAMALATADRRGRPSVRYVLLKEADARGFVFCTQTTGRKCRELRANPRASLVFYWPPTHRQVRVEGPVEEISRAEAVEHWMKRPRESRLAGLASKQSLPVRSHAALMAEFRRVSREHRGREVLAPATWTGFRVKPEAIEFWIRGEHRLHQRQLFTRRNGRWTSRLLCP